MTTLAVTAIGVDRPGIVAAVTGALVDHGCNLEDTSMSILRGNFAMVLIVAAPDGLEAAVLEEALATGGTTADLVVSVRTVGGNANANATTSEEGERWTVVVYGADHPGIVHGIASALAALGVNIVDLTTRVTAGPIYAMVMEVELPGALDGATLQERLATTAAGLGVECTLHPSEADIL